ncbi:MAG: serine protease [Halioglobus sp.]|jgi:serine protease
MTNKVTVVSLAFVVLLSACGGGGGSSSSRTTPTPSPEPTPAPPPTPPPIETPTGFRISGAISVSSNLGVDSDTNNPQGSFVENNSVATAQTLSNPSTLGGYVNQPGTGDQGPAQATGDTDDFFQIELLAGQTITLLVADFEQADADLYLYNTENQIIDFSIETGQVETIIIEEDGTFIVNVFAFSGATNYALAIGTSNGASPALATGTMSSAEIVPWQAIVTHTDSLPSNASSSARSSLNRRMGLQRRAGGLRDSGGRYFGSRTRPQLMGMDHLAPGQQRENRLGRAKVRQLQLNDPALKARWETLMTIKAMQNDPTVATVEPNYKVYSMATPNDAAYSFQWHYRLINLPAAWDLTTGDPNVIVAVIDTGILANHPDLAGQLLSGYDFIADPDTARDGNGIDSNPEDEGDGGDAGNSGFHGTHVSGTIAAASDNGIGVAGVAWNASIMPLRVLGVDGGTTYDVGQAVRYAAGLPNDSGTVPAQRADIINLSLGGSPFSQSTQTLFNEVRAAGVIVVAAAGNEATGTPSYPASFEGVISVSAVDSQRRAASYSNFGSGVDIAAPGGDNGEDFNGDGYPDGVLSTAGSISESGAVGFVYSFLNGTSMATPHVAGVLALMKAVNGDLSPQDIDVLLAQGDLSDDLGTPGRDDSFGHGLINAQRAVVAALTAAGNPPADNPRLSASTSLLNFGSAGQSLILQLQNSGNGDLVLNDVKGSQSWLKIAADSVDNSGLGSYQITVSREGLSPGIYSSTITADSTINSLTIEVLISVVDQDSGGDVGLLYLLLVDPETNEVAAQFDARVVTGVYPYQFDNIPAGNYELFAGTDADNDGLICDAGEACGAYLTTDQPIQIDLDGNLEEIEFPVEYRVAIPTLSSSLGQPKKPKTREIPRLR